MNNKNTPLVSLFENSFATSAWKPILLFGGIFVTLVAGLIWLMRRMFAELPQAVVDSFDEVLLPICLKRAHTNQF